MFIDGNKEENANGAAIWLDGPETIQNNNFLSQANYNLWDFYTRISIYMSAAIVAVGWKHGIIHLKQMIIYSVVIAYYS